MRTDAWWHDVEECYAAGFCRFANEDINLSRLSVFSAVPVSPFQTRSEANKGFLPVSQCMRPQTFSPYPIQDLCP